MKTTNFEKMQKRIMRRVYYMFGIRIATHATTMHLVVMAVSVYALGYFVHVAAVFRNASSVPIGDFGIYMFHVVTRADPMTMLVLGMVLVATVSLPFSLPHSRSVHST